MLLPNQEHLPRSDHESSGYESKASYLISTSNHNPVFIVSEESTIASYLISTSNHNRYWGYKTKLELLLISFLHQTTTLCSGGFSSIHCFLSHFYIKPQLTFFVWISPYNCFLSHFYIKPQLGVGVHQSVLYCFLSHFYIKPQLWSYRWRYPLIASYLISTSNHNWLLYLLSDLKLLLISFLHQTTTGTSWNWTARWLLLISFLHQTTTWNCNDLVLFSLLLISFLHQTTTKWC